MPLGTTYGDARSTTTKTKGRLVEVFGMREDVLVQDENGPALVDARIGTGTTVQMHGVRAHVFRGTPLEKTRGINAWRGSEFQLH